MKTLKTLTVGELIEISQQFSDDTPVVIAQPTHDHWGGIIVGELSYDNTDLMGVSWSDYHDAWKLDEAGDFLLVLGLNS